jgi:hypothetical protein
MLTGALLVSGGVLDLVAGTVSDAVGFGLVVLGTIYALTGFFGRRSGETR